MITEEQLMIGVLNLLHAKRKAHYGLILSDRACIYLAPKLSHSQIF
jgi:PIN domain nuclease of toxin-antitoxin system